MKNENKTLYRFYHRFSPFPPLSRISLGPSKISKTNEMEMHRRRVGSCETLVERCGSAGFALLYSAGELSGKLKTSLLLAVSKKKRR